MQPRSLVLFLITKPEVVNNISVNLKEKNTDLNDIRNDIREIKNRERTYRDANGDTITAYKNLKRRIKS